MLKYDLYLPTRFRSATNRIYIEKILIYLSNVYDNNVYIKSI